MTRNQKKISANGSLALLLLLINANILKSGWIIHANWYWLLLLTIPLQVAALVAQRRKSTKYVETIK
jgi:hypothetical protein